MPSPSMPLLAFDLDGTLIPDGGSRLDAATLDAMLDWQASGARVAVITARTELPDDLRAQFTPDAEGLCGGAVVRIGGTVKHSVSFTPEELQAVLDHDLDGAQVTVDTLTGTFLHGPAGLLDRAEVRAWMEQRGVLPLTEVDGTRVVKVRFVHNEVARHAAHLRAVQPSLVVTGAQAPYLSSMVVTPAGGDKGSALRVIAQALGIPVGNVVAFGDSDNDEALLAAAGHAVRVGEHPLLRDVADETVPSQAGLGAFLRDLRVRLSTPDPST